MAALGEKPLGVHEEVPGTLMIYWVFVAPLTGFMPGPGITGMISAELLASNHSYVIHILIEGNVQWSPKNAPKPSFFVYYSYTYRNDCKLSYIYLNTTGRHVVLAQSCFDSGSMNLSYGFFNKNHT